MAEFVFGIPFDEELFRDSMGSAPDPVKTAMLDSGALVNDSAIASMIASGSDLYTIPFYNILDGEEQNYDGKTDITVDEIDGDFQTGVVYGRAKGFFSRDFVTEMSKQDPMTHIAQSISRYQAKKRQKRMIGILGALFGITGASGFAKKWHDNHLVDLCSATATPYTIQATDLNNLATDALGDNKTAFSLVIMHSNVARTLKNMQVLEFWKQTDAQGVQRPTTLASANGYTVIIDDSVPAEKAGGDGANKDLTCYTTYLIGAGALRYAPGRVDKPIEPNRDVKKNGGQDELITRLRETIHPNGFSFKVPTAGWQYSASDAQLFASANWQIKFDPKAVPIAALRTNG